jgi:hypothetical protein
MEWRATLIARESAFLDIEDRRQLDGELCADVNKLDGMGDARITAAVKEIAARLDAQAVVDRAAKAEADRTVTIRPAPDCHLGQHRPARHLAYWVEHRPPQLGRQVPYDGARQLEARVAAQ